MGRRGETERQTGSETETDRQSGKDRQRQKHTEIVIFFNNYTIGLLRTTEQFGQTQETRDEELSENQPSC